MNIIKGVGIDLCYKQVDILLISKNQELQMLYHV